MKLQEALDSVPRKPIPSSTMDTASIRDMMASRIEEIKAVTKFTDLLWVATKKFFMWIACGNLVFWVIQKLEYEKINYFEPSKYCSKKMTSEFFAPNFVSILNRKF